MNLQQPYQRSPTYLFENLIIEVFRNVSGDYVTAFSTKSPRLEAKWRTRTMQLNFGMMLGLVLTLVVVAPAMAINHRRAEQGALKVMRQNPNKVARAMQQVILEDGSCQAPFVSSPTGCEVKVNYQWDSLEVDCANPPYLKKGTAFSFSGSSPSSGVLTGAVDDVGCTRGSVLFP